MYSDKSDPVTLPLIKKAVEILENRKQTAESELVFPSASSQSGHFTDPKKTWKRILKRANIEDLRIHDIRRTMGSYQAITGASLAIYYWKIIRTQITASYCYLCTPL